MSTRPVHLLAAACVDDPAAVQREAPELWRTVRRYNLPVQLALAAAFRAAAAARSPSRAALFSVAPFRSGSAELWSWVRDQSARDDLSGARLNPTHTLHVVDNLALSAFALAHGARGYCLGLGGAPGQAWCGLEAAVERLGAGQEEEALLFAGDHDDAAHSTARGVALLLGVRAGACAPLGRTVRIVALRRTPSDGGAAEPHSAAGLQALVEQVAAAPSGLLRWAVPARFGDGLQQLHVELALGERDGARRAGTIREADGPAGPANSPRVVVTGLGALSALGRGVPTLWDGLLAGRSGVRRIERFAAARLPVTTGGEVDALPHDLPDRGVHMARAAIAEALDDAGLTPAEAARAGFVWSTGLDTADRGPDGFVRCSSSACFAALARAFSGPRLMVAAACASGTQAIGEALRLLRAGRAAACVAGGSSVMLTSQYLIGFAALQVLAPDNGVEPAAACRPFDRRRRGFALADGAGALVLETLESARRRGAVPLAEVTGFGVSQDGFDLNRPLPDGSAAEVCMRLAVEEAGIEPADVGAVNAHATGTVLGDLAEAAALRRLLGGAAARVPVSSVKGALGHAMAAAGALEAIAAVLTCRHGVVPPTANLTDPDAGCALDHVVGAPRAADARRVLTVSFGMGGQNAAVLFERARP